LSLLKLIFNYKVFRK